ncbi:uncharacterized protein LOC143061777 [Mytilus galloprovincialis]|uniref:uncharacterized protein LOC143061777 n=1 Tax=Mytilus galloprovincialis TaxID=29158 RepID=UPI003F7C4F62
MYSFQYAQEDSFSFGGLVNIKYKVVNYQSERVFVVNMDIEVCYAAAGPCAVQHTVLTDIKLPKSSCNYSQPYAIPDFSLVSYMSELDVDTNVNQLPSWAVDLLMEELGIAGFQKDPQCELSSFSGALANGWDSTACGELITLPQLPAYTRCRLPSYCTGAQCCSDIGYLGRKLEAFVLVDPCSYSVSIGLEKRNINVTLLEFTQGSWQTVTLGNLLRLQYKAEELTAEKVYLLYMTISICFETVGDCRYSFTVFDGAKIPKQPCDWTGGYAIPGFNLNSYLTGQGYSTSTPLNSLVSSQLLEYMGVASLLNTPTQQCQMSDPLYISPTNGWTKDAGCTSTVDLPNLGSNSVCHLYDTCTGISCCLHSTTVDRNFNVFLKLDPCTQKLDIGIEKYQFDFSLYTFTFETTQYFHIDRVIEIEYKITDLVGEMVYLVDMKVKICFNDPTPCDLQNTIVLNTKLPIMVCPWFRGYPNPSWSLTQWYLDNSLTPGSNLDSSAVSSLMEASEIGKYLLSPMVSRDDPFGTYASAYLGWSSECTEAPVTLLQMDQSVISCNLENTCRGLSCALDVPFISKTFEFYMRLEQCDYMLKVGIERQQYERTLKEYQWGEWTHVDLNGIFKMSFVLHDLHAEPAFLISMKLSLCWEANQPCGTVYNIFDKVRLPKKVCDWDKKFLQNDFSLNQYKTNNGITTLDDHHVSDILRLTGISQYMKRNPCVRTAAPYDGADGNNWKNDCADPVGSLLPLGSDTTCQLDSSCTAFDCCLDSTSLGLTFNGYVRLDPCNYKIYIGLEGIDLDYTLIDFSFGTVQHYAMNEVFNLDFVVDDLTADKVYVVTMNMSVCLESGGACEVLTNVFQDHRLPKAECDYDSQFVIPGFNLNEYLDERSVPTNTVPLDVHTIAQLLHDTALAPYMMDDACDQTVIPYYPNDQGWNRACEEYVELPVLQSGTICHLYSSCTGVTCCSSFPRINRNVNTQLKLDPCNRKMIIVIEKLEITISLFGYTYGEVKKVKLHGVIGLEFKIENLEAERKFMVDLEMSICMETNGSCEITVPVLISTALPKAPCEWKNDYVQADFSFLGFLNEKGIGVNDNLDINQLSALIERLAIGDFLMDTQCSSSASPYSGHTNGWTNSCGQSMAALPTLSGAVCNVGSDCTSVYCCLPDTRIGKSFETFVKFEPCLFTLSVGIDKLTFSTLLFDYEWGQLTEVWLFGYVRMEFTVKDLEMEGDYLIDMKLQICRESDTVTTPCGVDIVIFDKYRLPKLSCDWNSGLDTGFQGLTTWLTDNSVTKTEPLRGPETSKLMSDAGIAAYLYEPPCDQQGSTYSGNVGGVKNDCGMTVSVPVLPSGVVCTVSMDTCTGLECCITIPLTNKTMNFRININHCYLDITVGLESMYRQYKLLDYTFGTIEHFNLIGVGRMEYKIEDFIGEGAYLLDVSFSFCLETGSCEFTETIIQDVKFPKKRCTWDDTYRVKDFSLNQWSRERSIDTKQVYPAYYISELLQNLDLTRYFQSSQCSRTTSPYDSPTNGWKKECSDTDVVTNSTNPMTCRLKSDCAAISCCLDEDFISKTFEVFFEIDDCERKIYIGIEKLKFYIPLHDFEFDKWHEFSLVKTIRIRYNIYDLWSEGVYMVSLEISSCWEMYSSCAWTQSVLDYARFKKQTCASQMTYQNAGFSLTTWATSNSIDKDAMTETDLTRLYDELDVAWYLKNSCDYEMSPFIANGWNNTCGSTINNLPMLPSGTSCYISDVCTDVRCCVSVPFLGNHTFDFSLNLYGCTQYMEISLENYKEQFMLRDYTFGLEDYLWIKGVFRLKYTIDDLPDQNLYRISVMFEVCTTNGALCEYSLTVMDSVELPRSSCLPHWGYGYSKDGFTKEQWKTSRGLEDDATLNAWQIAKLLEETEVALYQNKPRCNHTMGDYQGSVDGWVNNCTFGVSPGVLDGDIVCLIGSKCSEVSCCVNDPETMSDFNAYLSLDPCQFTLLIGVEKYSFEVSLIGFDFEKSYELDLGGIYKVSFSVDDLMYSGMYVVNMTVSICWSSGQDCQFVSQIFQNTLLPKHTCDTQTDFAQPGFSYTSWLSTTGYTDATPLTGDTLDDLEEVLDIVKFYEPTSFTVVNASSNGWNDECAFGMVDLPDISPEANCTLQPHCTAIDCSIFSPRLGRSFHAAVDIDPCHARMMVQIEKMNFNVGLLEKQYGDLWQVWLRGVVRIDFTINNLPIENMYLVNMNLSVCFESSGACEVGPVNIFVNTLLHKKTCDFSSDFVVTGFSLEAMRQTYHLVGVTTLPSYFVQQVLNTASVSQYLLEPSCNRLSSPFGTTYDGWMKGCTTQSLTLEYIKPTETTCYTLPDCTGFQCCVDASIIGRSFLYKISVDACKYKLTVGIEGLEYEQNLLTYKFGTQDKFYINGVFKMDYQIEELPIHGSYLLSVTLSVCLEANDDCAVQRVVASSLKLDKPTCTSNGQFAIPGFSLTDWKASKGLSNPLPEYAASLLMSDLNIAKFMQEPQCTIASPGWQSGGKYTKEPQCTIASLG